MKVSIIIPVKEINDYIRESVPKIHELNYKDYEIIIVTDHKENFKSKKTRIIPVGDLVPGDKRDIGAKKAKGEILAFLDDDAWPKEDWLNKALKHFSNEDVAAVGGPAVTPDNDSDSQKASGLILSLGAGEMTYRYIPGKRVMDVDDFPSVNLLVRKDVFNKIGGFKNEFWPGEDTEFCHRLVYKEKKRIIYDPKVLVYHHRRKLFKPHLRQLWGYTKHRAYFLKKFRASSLKLNYFVPIICVIAFFLMLVLSFFNVFVRDIFIIILIIYVIYLSTLWIRSKNFKIGGMVFLGAGLSHFVYGVGFLYGFLLRDLRREKKVE